MNRNKLKNLVAKFREGSWAADSSWKTKIWFVGELICRLLGQLAAFRVNQRAAGIAFFTAVAFVPTLVILVIIAEQLELLGPASDYLLDAIIQNYIPIEKDQVLLRINKWVSNARESGAGRVGSVVAVVASLSLFSGFYELINDLWHVQREGGFLHKISRFAIMLTIGPPLLLISTSISTFMSFGFIDNLPLFAGMASRIAPLFLTFAVGFIGLKLMPRTKVNTQYAAIAALLAAAIFEITKYGFGLYVSNIMRGTWLPIYGAIFILPVFLLWNYVVALVVAGTASVAFLLQHWEHEQSPQKKTAHELFIRANISEDPENTDTQQDKS